MNKLNQCPYCGGIAKGCTKTVESFRKIHNYYVVCTECGASTERYDTEFTMLQDGKFHVLTKKEAIEKAIHDWNNGIFDTQTKLLHMTVQEKLLWYTADLLGVAWYGANVLVGSLRWETAWKLRKIAERQKLLRLNSGKDYNMEAIAGELLHDGTVRCVVSSYIKEIDGLRMYEGYRHNGNQEISVWS